MSSGLFHSSSGLQPLRRVVITGIGSISPLGNSMELSWKNLFQNSFQDSFQNSFPSNGDNNTTSTNSDIGITTLEQSIQAQNLPPDLLSKELELISTLPSQVAAPVRGIEYDPRTSRFVQFALHAGYEAARNANLIDWLEIDPDITIDNENEENVKHVFSAAEIQRRRQRAGISLGIGLTSVRDIYSIGSLSQKLNRISPHFVPKILPNSAPSRVSINLSLQGPNHSITTACAASSHAIIDGIRCIQMYDADIMLVGGFESCIDPLSMAGFCRLRALSTQYKHNYNVRNDSQTIIKNSSRPFHAQRDGFVMGEGGAILVLEEMEHALKRLQNSKDAKILAEVIGYGTTADAYHMTAPEKDGKGAERAISMALDRAAHSYLNINGNSYGNDEFKIRDAVQYINAHATSTPMGDDVEVKLLDRMFMRNNGIYSREHDLYVSSTKGATGHLLGGAGALEAAYTVMAITDGKIPPTQNLNSNTNMIADHATKSGTNDNDCIHNVGFTHVTEDMGILQKDVRIAMSNSLGFGGTNASLVFAKFDHDIN